MSTNWNTTATSGLFPWKNDARIINLDEGSCERIRIGLRPDTPEILEKGLGHHHDVDVRPSLDRSEG